MVRDLLLRGMLAGLVAGLLAFGFAKMFGEPQVELAIHFEELDAGVAAHDHAHDAHGAPSTTAREHSHGGEALVSRRVQSGLGLLTAVLVYGTAMGGLFALAFAFLYGRVGESGPRTLALLLALGVFAVVYYVPSLKYPASPPAVGDAATIGYRTGLFFLMILIALGALVLAATVGRALALRHGGLNGWPAGAALFAGILAAAQLLMPEVNEVPADFPAALLWNFRMASLSMQALMWVALGLVFGWLAERRLRQGSGKEPANVLRSAWAWLRDS
jgi:predicted cobalt transporter CbtA